VFVEFIELNRVVLTVVLGFPLTLRFRRDRRQVSGVSPDAVRVTDRLIKKETFNYVVGAVFNRD
jgi:hypothetical protein